MFAEGNITRDSIFVTSKLWNTDHGKVKESCKKTLAVCYLNEYLILFHMPHGSTQAQRYNDKDLKLSYLDLYLIHWPLPFPADCHMGKVGSDGKGVLDASKPLQETWKAMESLVKEGLVKHIGVSNFTKRHIEDILKVAEIPPAMNQVVF